MSVGWRREHAVGRDGERFRYIALDVISRPFDVDGRLITRVVGKLPYSCKARCGACGDPFTTEVSTIVEHTTFGPPQTTTVCWRCANDPGWRERECRERSER